MFGHPLNFEEPLLNIQSRYAPEGLTKEPELSDSPNLLISMFLMHYHLKVDIIGEFHKQPRKKMY